MRAAAPAVQNGDCLSRGAPGINERSSWTSRARGGGWLHPHPSREVGRPPAKAVAAPVTRSLALAPDDLSHGTNTFVVQPPTSAAASVGRRPQSAPFSLHCWEKAGRPRRPASPDRRPLRQKSQTVSGWHLVRGKWAAGTRRGSGKPCRHGGLRPADRGARRRCCWRCRRRVRPGPPARLDGARRAGH